MGRLDRFKKLERARPDAPSGDRDEKSSLRFNKIEPAKAQPAAAAPDPFAPPPEPDISLDVEPADARDRQRKTEREERAKKELALEAQRRAEVAMRKEAHETGIDHAVSAWHSIPRQTQITVGMVALSAVLAATVSPYFLGIAAVIFVWSLKGRVKQ